MTSVNLTPVVVGGEAGDNPGQVQTLSDGSGLVVYRSSTTGVQFNHTTDRINYTVKNAYFPASWNTSFRYFGMTIDASDNVHFCWNDSTNTIKYVKFTKSAGPTWTSGTAETVGSAGGALYGPPSVEAMDAGAILVGWQVFNGAGAAMLARFRLRMTGGAWSSEFTDQVDYPPFGGLGAGKTWAPSLARDSAGAVSNEQKFAFMIGGVSGTSATISFKLGVKTINLTTGAVVSTTIIDAAALGGVNGNTVETFGVFTAGPGVWHGGGSQWDGAGIRVFYGFRISATGYTSGPFSEALLTASLAESGIVYVANRVIILQSESATPGSLYAKVIAFDDPSGLTSIRFLTRFTWDSNATTGLVIERIISGSNRNGSFAHGDVVLIQTDTSVKVKANFAVAQTSTLSTPSAGSTVTTNNVPLSSNPYGGVSGQQFKPRYEVSTSPSFSPSQFFEAPNDQYRVAGTSIPNSNSVLPDGVVTQGSWYVRVRSMDPWGMLGTNTAANAFTVAHTPSAVIVAPEPSETAAYDALTEFSWTFLDGWASDYQTAYNLVIERNDTGASILDTGKLVAVGGSAGTRQTVYQAISSSLKGIELRVKVRVWDSSDVASAFTTYSVFTLVDPPTVNITVPAAGTLSNPNVVVQWTFSASGRTQSAFQVVITKSDGSPVFNSGTRGGADVSFAPDVTLENLTDYIYLVRVYDSTSGAVSATDTQSVTTSWTPPDDTTSAQVDISSYELGGYVTIIWDDTSRDASFYSWQVWRTDVISGDVVLVLETRVDATDYEFHDYTVANRRAYLYDVIQTATRFSIVVPGPLGSSAQMSVAADALIQGDYWLIHRSDSTYTMALRHVTSDKYVPNEIERQEIPLIGRGRKVDYGTEYGPKGVLTAQIRDWYNSTTGLTESARTIRQRLELLQGTKADMYLRNPFGDIWLVAMSDIDIDRMAGVGASEFVTVTVPYAGVTGAVTAIVFSDASVPDGTDVDGGSP